jgi:hypothetical protein
LAGNFSLPKKPTNSFIGNLNTISRKNDSQESDVNKGKTVDNLSKDNLTKEVDLRKITTSPIVIVYKDIILEKAWNHKE